MIRVWCPQTGKQIPEFDVGSAANYLAFTPTGKTLVAVLWAGPFLVIDTSDWSIVNKVAASEMRTHGHALTPD